MPELSASTVTAAALDGDRERCLEAGMTGYLTKPVWLDALREVLARHTLEIATTLRPDA